MQPEAISKLDGPIGCQTWIRFYGTIGCQTWNRWTY